MNKAVVMLLVVLIGLIIFDAGKKSQRINKIESYLTHQHGYDASKELGFYNPFDGGKD